MPWKFSQNSQWNTQDKVKCLVKLQSVIGNYPKKRLRHECFPGKLVNFFKTSSVTAQIMKFSFKHFFKDFFRDRLQILSEFKRINYLLLTWNHKETIGILMISGRIEVK